MSEVKLPLESEAGTGPFDAQWLILRAHQIAIGLGAERIRLDRGVWSVEDGLRYYEVGYGPMFTVTVTSNKGGVLRFTKETWKSRSYAQARIREFLTAVREGER